MFSKENIQRFLITFFLIFIVSILGMWLHHKDLNNIITILCLFGESIFFALIFFFADYIKAKRKNN